MTDQEVTQLISDVKKSKRPHLYLRDAVHNNKPEEVKIFLTLDFLDPSTNSDYLLKTAAYYNYHEIVKLLLKHPKVNPLVKDCEPLRWAISLKHFDVLRAILRDGRVDNIVINRYIRSNRTLPLIKNELKLYQKIGHREYINLSDSELDIMIKFS